MHSSLENQIKTCLENKNQWQYFIADYVELANEVWHDLSDELKLFFQTIYDEYLSSFISSFPINNANKLLKLFDLNVLKIVRGDATNCLYVEDGNIKGKGCLESQKIDLVINASGVTCKQLPDKLIHSLMYDGVEVNEFGGIKIDANTMKATTDKQNYNFYVIGALAKGSLAVLNYIRASVVQAEKIGADLVTIGYEDTVCTHKQLKCKM